MRELDGQTDVLLDDASGDLMYLYLAGSVSEAACNLRQAHRREPLRLFALPRPMNRSPESGPLLSVVTPVFNGAGFIAENVEIIRSEFARSGVSYELIVVSTDPSTIRLEQAPAAGHPEVRVLHYDRNVGKGYAVKLGLLAARGQYVGFIDPTSTCIRRSFRLSKWRSSAKGSMLQSARSAIHARRSTTQHGGACTWPAQQLIRVLFDLDVRDTQVA